MYMILMSSAYGILQVAILGIADCLFRDTPDRIRHADLSETHGSCLEENIPTGQTYSIMQPLT
jgi:hypothetical protein